MAGSLQSPRQRKLSSLPTEKDGSALLSASFGITGIRGKAQTSVVHLISEVMEAANTNTHGGADGLAAEFATSKKQKRLLPST
jgi:hypothetical protein